MGNSITLQVGVKILLKNKEGKYLLLHRSAKKYPEVQGRWDIVGGRINPGTTLIENLRREVKEETDLEIIGEPILIAAQDIMTKSGKGEDRSSGKHSGKHIVRLTYTGEAKGEVKLDTQENDDYKWYSFEELAKIPDLDVYFKEALKNIKAGQINS